MTKRSRRYFFLKPMVKYYKSLGFRVKVEGLNIVLFQPPMPQIISVDVTFDEPNKQLVV